MERVTISGTTRVAGVVGRPLAHSLSPAMHNAAYAHLGLDWVYVPFEVEGEGRLAAVLEAASAAGFVGLNVTMPYKQAALALCDEVATPARMAGAVNTIDVVDGRLVGYNTDGRGLIDSLRDDLGYSPEGADVALLGAGGAAGAVLVALILAGASRVSVVNRTLENAEALVERVRPHLRTTEAVAVQAGEGSRAAITGADLIVNATSAGMAEGDSSPVPPEWLGDGHVVVDLVYGRETALLHAATAAGARAADGLGMLVAQGALAVDIWCGEMAIRAPRDVMRRAAEEALELRAEGGAR